MKRIKVRGGLKLSTAAILVSQLSGSALGLLNSVLIARILGAAGRGEVAFLTSVAGLIAFLSTLSAHEFLANARGRGDAELGELLGSSAVLGVLLGGAGALTMWFALSFVPGLRADVDALSLVFALVAIPVIVTATYLSYLARAEHSHTVANIAWAVIAAANLTLNVLLAVLSALSARTAILAWALGQTVSLIVLVWHFRSTWRKVRPPSKRVLRQSVRFGVKAHLGGLMNTGSYQLDYWLLGSMVGPRALGLYTVAASWFSMLLLLPTAVVLAMRPKLVSSDPELAALEATRAVRLSWLITAVAALALYPLAPLLTEDVFGAEFAESAGYLRILSLGAFGVCALKIFGVTLTAQNRPLSESLATAVGFSVALGLYIMLIPRFGAMGAAWASTISYTCAGLAAAVVFAVVFRTKGKTMSATLLGLRR